MKLIVEESGFSFNLPRVGMIRTPVELEIKESDINIIISTLKMIGISKYKIIGDDNLYIHALPKNIRNIKAKKPEKVIIERVKENTGDSIELAKLSKKFDQMMISIQELTEKGILKPKQITKTVYVGEDTKVEKITNDADEEFVPEISLDGFEISSGTSNEIDIESDAANSADILRELKEGNE